MGIIGPALAQSISTLLNIAILQFVLLQKSDMKEMFFWPTKESVDGIFNYIKIGFFGMCIIWLEWCAFEFLTLMSGYLDVDSTGAQIILFNFECLIFMPAMAMSWACSSLVGKYIGEGNHGLAKRFSMGFMKLCLAQTMFQQIIIIIARYYISVVYTDVESVRIKVENCLFIIAFGQFFNQMQAVCQGTMRGLGNLQAASLICAIAYYGFAIPLGYIFTFIVGNDGKGWGLNGLWYGMFSGQFVLVVLYQYYIHKKTDWAECSRIAKERTEKDAKLINQPSAQVDDSN